MGVYGKPPKRITAVRLRNVAVAYLRRYGGSASRLRTILERRVDRSVRFHQELSRAAECAGMVEALLAELASAGVLDEAREARAQALRGALAGRPRRVIEQRLRGKGFEPSAVEAAVTSLERDAMAGGQEADWVACCRYARRRRLGPFRAPGARERSRESQLQALLRAGFRYGMAARVLDATDAAELEAVLDEGSTPTLYR